MDLAEDVEEQITIIQADITFIQADQTTQDQRLFDVEEEVETVEADIDELDSRVFALVELNVTVQMLESDVKSLRQNDTELTEDLETVAGNVGSLNASIEDVEQRIQILEQEETIAFHAYLGTYSSIPEKTVVEENLGNGYNDATG